MTKKIGWILFGIMTVVVIVLSSVLIANEIKWKSGDELLDIDIENVDTAYLIHHICSPNGETKEYELSSKEIEYIIKEFKYSKFERTNRQVDAGSSKVIFKMKDGSEKSFSKCSSVFTINGKQYECHSYLSTFIGRYGWDD